MWTLKTKNLTTQFSREANNELNTIHQVDDYLRFSLPKSGPLDFATKNNFPLFFVGEEALAGIY